MIETKYYMIETWNITVYNNQQELCYILLVALVFLNPFYRATTLHYTLLHYYLIISVLLKVGRGFIFRAEISARARTCARTCARVRDYLERKIGAKKP